MNENKDISLGHCNIYYDCDIIICIDWHLQSKKKFNDGVKSTNKDFDWISKWDRLQYSVYSFQKTLCWMILNKSARLYKIMKNHLRYRKNLEILEISARSSKNLPICNIFKSLQGFLKILHDSKKFWKRLQGSGVFSSIAFSWWSNRSIVN